MRKAGAIAAGKRYTEGRPEPPEDQLRKLLEQLRAEVVQNCDMLPEEPYFGTSEDTLMRFLRARNFNVKEAFKQLCATMEWRREYRPKTIECHWCAEQPGYHGIRQVGFDKERRPVMYACFAQCQTTKNTSDDIIAHCVYLIENAKRCTEHNPGNWVFVIDCTGLTLACCNPKLGRKFIKAFSTYYPERLCRFIIVHHNPIFHGVWKAIKVFIDPVTVQKLKLVRKEKLKALFIEQFDEEMVAWLHEEMELNKLMENPSQTTFWKDPKIDNISAEKVHDPRGTPSYVAKYIESLKEIAHQMPGVPLCRRTVGPSLYLPHPNVVDQLNGRLDMSKVTVGRKEVSNDENVPEKYGVLISSNHSDLDDDSN